MKRSGFKKLLTSAVVAVMLSLAVIWWFAARAPAEHVSDHQVTGTVITALGQGDIVITHDETYIVLAVDGEMVTVRAVSSWEKTRTLAKELAMLNPIVVSTKDLNYCNIARHIISR